MKKILLATVAALPLIAVGVVPASSQDLKQQGKGISQPQGAGGQEKSREAQGKSDAGATKMNRAAGSQEKANQAAAQDKSPQRTEGRASSGRDANAGASDRNEPKSRADQGKQADQGKAKQGGSKSGQEAAGNAQQQHNAGSKSQVSQGQNNPQSKSKQNPTSSAQSNGGKNEPARTTGQANRPNQDNAQQNQRNQNPQNQNNERAQQNGGQNQGSQASGRVTLDESQRTKVERTVLSSRDVPRVDRVDFGVDVGVEVPQRIRIREVPETLVEINPQWRSDEYFVVRDEIVIVDHSRKIVAVVPVGSSSTSIETRSSASAGQPDIRRVQEVLIEKGFYHGRADGVMGPETRQALISFQQREGIEAHGRIDERTSTALGISVGTEGRGGQADQKQGQFDQKGSTSGQSGRDVNRDNNANKGDAEKNAADKSAADKNASDKNASEKAGQNNRPTTSGQGGNRSSDEGKGSGQPGGTAGQSTRPQNQPNMPNNTGAGRDNQQKRNQ
jgi:hypothetical protein